ncbi:ribose operon repressor [Rodentibacter pneumotropicus]|uniref:Ribose operon repressor n=1 Tax=Rodentibacter pneumotropicus TaxID=758 RepID=A0A448MIS0_9PAST|nr:ribose operon repressor [Rodentibacter pneumotropicus]
MATMKDIARLAKVSTSTVSHVINGSRFVSDEIREKVMLIVADLNYTPSAVARSLKVKETKTIGLLVTATNNPFFAEVMAGVEQYCHQHQYNLIIATTGGDAKRLQQNLQTLLHKQVDGLLLMCGDSRFNADTELSISVPLVIMDWWFKELNADKILENSTFGGYLATKTLIEAGHQNIGIITGNLKKSVAKNRLEGYKKALSEAEIPLNNDWLIESHFDFEGGIIGMQNYLPHHTVQLPYFVAAMRLHWVLIKYFNNRVYEFRRTFPLLVTMTSNFPVIFIPLFLPLTNLKPN